MTEPKSGVRAIGGVEEIRKYATLDGNPIGDGPDAKDFILLPPWFKRTGRLTYTVDSGFGVLKCRGVVCEDEELLALLKNSDDADYGLMLEAIRALPPGWTCEEAITIGGKDYAEGDLIPSLDEARKFTPEDRRRYCTEILPPSLIQQIITGQRYVSVPPIPYTTTADPR